MMRSLQSSLLGFMAFGLVACASGAPGTDLSELTPRQQQLAIALASYSGTYDVSDAAMQTAVLDEKGKPVGLIAYNDPSDAIRAGDTAAFIASIKTATIKDDDISAFPAMVLAFDQAAAGDYQLAIETLSPALEDDASSGLAGFLNAWFLAFDGRYDEAISTHRSVGYRLPGLTGDLSLAAMLESLGRTDEALAVYQTMTPVEITAPAHDFDPQGLVFSHVQLVVARQALLLRSEGRIEEAQALYTRLAAAEPEKATGYNAAIDALETGRGLDDDVLTKDRAFAQAMADYSRSVAFQRILRGVITGNRVRGFDESKGALDQLTLLIDPANDDLRLNVHDDLFDHAMYDGALHVIRSAPEATASLSLAEAATLLRMSDFEGVDVALQRALKLADEEEALSATSAAMGLYALMKQEDNALSLAGKLPGIAETPAEKAAAFGLSSAVYSQFAKYDEALKQSRAAQALDDTHDRRIALSNALAEAGQIDEGLTILRSEALARPNDPYMLNTLGYYLVVHTDRLDEAFKVLARASALAPNDAYIADSFGWIRYKMGDLEGALRYIELSRRELSPNRHWEIEDHIGDIYWHMGREDDAREAWNYALKEFPPETERELITEKLENGLTEPAPEKRPLPKVSFGDDGEVERNDI